MSRLRATTRLAGALLGVLACSSNGNPQTGASEADPAMDHASAGGGGSNLFGQNAGPIGGAGSAAGDTDLACVGDFVTCTVLNQGDSSACLEEASACGLPSPEGIAACAEAMFGCAQGSPLDYNACVSATGACRTSDAITAWNAGADLATESAELAVALPTAFLIAIGTALKPLGVKFIFDAVANVLCVVPQIVRCSTLADYIQCVQSHPGQPGGCAAEAAECGFTSMDQVALAKAAECAASLSQCPNTFATCAASSPSCDQFGPFDLASAEFGVATKSTADILMALLPVLRFEESEFGGCQCAEEYSQCVAQAAPEDVAACAVTATSCSSGGPPTSPPPPPTPMSSGAPD